VVLDVRHFFDHYDRYPLSYVKYSVDVFSGFYECPCLKLIFNAMFHDIQTIAPGIPARF